MDERIVAHELGHVFVGLGPDWFTEGVAELVAFLVTGKEGSYTLRRATGMIRLEARAGTIDVDYSIQGSLGAQLLMEMNRLLGSDVMSAAIRQIAANPKTRSGQQILDTFAKEAPSEKKEQLERLFKQRIDFVK
jgi:hypothetical protein